MLLLIKGINVVRVGKLRKQRKDCFHWTNVGVAFLMNNIG